MTAAIRRLALTLVATGTALVIAAFGVEVWVRWSWDAKRGTPGLFLSDPVLSYRLAPNYRGWFAGVPVHINNLGFRDTRDYSLDKPPGTFRILLLGDSVTFGHGATFETTYPHLLERELRQWRADVNWEVWNAGVPGYNTSQELAYLDQIGPAVAPDLVVVGFFPNDIFANDVIAKPSLARHVLSTVRNVITQRFYSAEFYRRAYLQFSWRWLSSDVAQRMLSNLAGEDALLADPGQIALQPQQALTPVELVSDAEIASVQCESESEAATEIRALRADPAYASWRKAVDGLRALHRDGRYKVVVFLNTAPEPCPGDDLYFDGGSRLWDDFFAEQFEGMPTVSSYDAFLHRRPSQMPEAKAHSLGNANLVKAQVLFTYIRGFAR